MASVLRGVESPLMWRMLCGECPAGRRESPYVASVLRGVESPLMWRMLCGECPAGRRESHYVASVMWRVSCGA